LDTLAIAARRPKLFIGAQSSSLILADKNPAWNRTALLAAMLIEVSRRYEPGAVFSDCGVAKNQIFRGFWMIPAS
jgi:hypothetical protein